MRKSNLCLLWMVFLMTACHSIDEKKTNILFVISDDQSYPHTSINGTSWIKTPGFDRVAQEGLLFTQAYTTNAKCSPSRSSILTGRNSWLLEEATNHVPYFPEKFITFPEVLKSNGFKTGYTGKGWAPGVAMKDGKKRDLIGKVYLEKKLDPPASFISKVDYFENFKLFLNEKSEDQPFFFWVGGHEPHRAYEYEVGLKKGKKNINEIDRVPDYWPNSDNVKADMLDYAFEIEYFDRHLVDILDELEKRNLLENTIVVVTSDNGMPFPRVKGQVYPFDNRLPLAIRWGKGIKNPGRVISDYFSFSDFAPTFLDLAGIPEGRHNMEPFSGKSWKTIFDNHIDPNPRPYMIVGKERHDVGRENDQGYPVRGILEGKYFYSQNFKPERWPAGNPETGYLNTDGSPTKTEILNLHRQGKDSTYWNYAFGKRPQEELYNIEKDPLCLENLAEHQDYSDLKTKLKKQLISDLKEQGDPRILGNGDVFDQYPYSGENVKNFYSRYMDGEKIETHWVNPTDFEK
ncbi:MAG: sulfatase-like hydrolase/transferase [Flavobacteriaceae bacterium]|jgi:N-sulfoglucosamine sulfohydrolase|nr:sulfatase-like hydrolase/transferase [Flavobacteriaceae bacterium]